MQQGFSRVILRLWSQSFDGAAQQQTSPVCDVRREAGCHGVGNRHLPRTHMRPKQLFQMNTGVQGKEK